MTRIPADTPIPEASTDVFAAASNNRQPQLNLHRQMVHSPAVFGRLPRHPKGIGGPRGLGPPHPLCGDAGVPAAEEVPYTIAVNSVLATRAGFRPDQIDAIVMSGSCGDAKLDALLILVRHATRHRGGVSEQAFQQALQAGYSDAELAETFVSIQLASFVDRFVNYAQTPFNVPTAAEAA